MSRDQVCASVCECVTVSCPVPHQPLQYRRSLKRYSLAYTGSLHQQSSQSSQQHLNGGSTSGISPTSPAPGGSGSGSLLRRASRPSLSSGMLAPGGGGGGVGSLLNTSENITMGAFNTDLLHDLMNTTAGAAGDSDLRGSSKDDVSR